MTSALCLSKNLGGRHVGLYIKVEDLKDMLSESLVMLQRFTPPSAVVSALYGSVESLFLFT